MKGVEILLTQEVAVDFGFNWMLFLFVILGFMFVGAAIGCSFVFSDDRELKIIPYTMFIFLMIGILVGAVVGYLAHVPTKYETQYKVTVSDKVYANDFLAKYDVISQEGEFYNVRERNEK